MLCRMLPCALLALLAVTMFARAATIKMPPNSDIAKRDLPKWDWTKDKVYGTNLGGLFLLERWMYEDWMVEKGGDDAWDEYTMSKNVGDGMYDILNEHFDSWFTEDDMDTLADAGVNMLRIPMGYWPFVSADEAGEPYKTASHLDKLSQIMKWSQDRHMYVLLDLHGMPGSQNNDQSSGRNHTSNDHKQVADWYSDHNQQLSRKVVHKMLDWLDSQPSKSVVAGITTVNEPKVYDNGDYQGRLFDFYGFSIDALKPHGIPLIAHHAFVSNPYGYWRDFAQKQETGTFVLDDHPYPAWFQSPEPTDEGQIFDSVCRFRDSMANFPAPVLMGEFSAISALDNDDWVERYVKTQLKVYGWSAGSMFFNFKMKDSGRRILGLSSESNKKYSMLRLLEDTIPNRDTSKSVKDWTNSLSDECGDDPNIHW